MRELLACTEQAADPLAARAAISEVLHDAFQASTPLPDATIVRDRLRRGLHPVATLTVGQWLRTWLSERTDLRPATALSYRSLVEGYLVPLLGDVLLEELRPGPVRDALARMAEQSRDIATANAQRRNTINKASVAWHAHDATAAREARDQLAAIPRFRRPAGPVTVQQVRAVLRSALSEAVRREMIPINAAKLVTLPTPRRARPLEWTPPRVAAWRKTGARPSPVMVWTPAQTRAFLDHSAKHRLSGLFVLLAYTGMRRGEICGLRWEDVDFDAGTVQIRRQLTQVGTETVEGHPKTDAGERTIALARAAYTALTARQRAQATERHTLSDSWSDTGLVFTRPDGTALNPADVSDLFDRLARATGLPPIRLHDLRHGAATRALDAGIPVNVVSDMLGHSSTTVTLDLYATVTNHSRHAAADAIARQLEQ